MHPAKSVILFTTSSGAGYGLIVVAALFDALGLMPRDPVVTASVLILALALVSVGLLASTFHLGHPERAWRAVTQWRTSWLSREGVAALWTYLPVLAWGVLRGLTPEAAHPVEPALAAVAAASALVTIYCTAMIYASLKAVPMWATRWTPAAYLLLGPATGAVIYHAIAHGFGFAAPRIAEVATLLLLLALVAKVGYWKHAQKGPGTSTVESATGLGVERGPDGPVAGADGAPRTAKASLLEAPHSESNYLMQEMGFRITRKHAGRLRRIALVWTFIFPMLGITVTAYSGGWAQWVLIGLSLATAAVGLVAERYLFFAEARHVQALYYGENAA